MMPEIKKGRLFVISGPSGAGKSSLIEDALKSLPGFVRSVSVTTRPARKNEKYGRKYIYITEEQFRNMVNENQLLECANYCDFSYGTPAKSVEEELNKGNNVILEIEVQGALQVKKKDKNAYMIFISTPNIDILEKRLKKRNTERDKEIEKRLKTALKEFEYQKHYDCIIINNNYNEALLNLIHILQSQREY
jgi:guanylate kinase